MALRLSNYFLVLASLLWLTSLSFSPLALAQSSGIATFYTPPYNPSACYGFEDNGVMIAAASDEFWDGGAACGQMYQVTCLSGTNEGTPHPCSSSDSVVVKIVDYCPSGCRGTIDLSQEAFASIADPDSGTINVSYQKC